MRFVTNVVMHSLALAIRPIRRRSRIEGVVRSRHFDPWCRKLSEAPCITSPIRQSHYRYALLSWQPAKGHIVVSADVRADCSCELVWAPRLDRYEERHYGNATVRLSVLGFGCGAVGGLMVRGDPRDQERTIARAIAVGVNYFDTAVQYGNGESEKNLGRILQSLKPANAVVGTKVRLPSAKFSCIADTVATSLEGSLVRLRRDRVDIFHLHNSITESGGGEALSVEQVLGEVVPAFERLRQQGKIRFLGITAVGETTALDRVIDARAFDSAQVVYNMLNPSAATELPANYPAQDYGRLFDHTVAAGVGVVGIRVLAAARCPDRLRATRLRARRPNRSARL
jgi:diketogulonate reductase-like aldo/keto reductase